MKHPKKRPTSLYKIKTVVNNNLFLPLILFLSSFALYVNNLSWTVWGGDSGDIITAAATRGIAHPSGYPLYVYLGNLLTKLPIKGEVAFRVGLLSSLSSAISVAIFFLIIKKITNKNYIAFVASLTLAFSYTFWLYAEVVEVFSLHILFVLLIIYISIQYYKTRKEKLLYLLAFVCGLSLTNNQVILLLFPVVFIFLILIDAKTLFKIKNIFRYIICFLIGLLPYLYIPWAASHKPYMNWGNVNDLTSFLNLILRKQYGGWVNTQFDFNFFYVSLLTYVEYIIHHNNILLLIFAGVGTFYLFWKRDRKLYIFLLLVFLFLGPFFIFYAKTRLLNFGDFVVAEKFYAQSIAILILFFGLGLSLSEDLVKRMVKNPIFTKNVIVLSRAVFLFIPISLFLLNIEKNNFRRVFTGKNLAEDMTMNIEKGSVLFLSQDDTLEFNVLYLTGAIKKREDLIIPGLHNQFKPLLNLTKNYKEYELVRDYSKIDLERWLPVLSEAMNERTVYTSFKFNFKDLKTGKKIISVPRGFLYRLEVEENKLDKAKYLREVEKTFSEYSLDDLRKNEWLINSNYELSHIRRLYAWAYMNTSEFIFEYFDDPKTSAIYVNKALDLDPTLEQKDVDNFESE